MKWVPHGHKLFSTSSKYLPTHLRETIYWQHHHINHQSRYSWKIKIYLQISRRPYLMKTIICSKIIIKKCIHRKFKSNSIKIYIFSNKLKMNNILTEGHTASEVNSYDGGCP